jgi:uncharacterized protein (DUF1919 family)
MTKRLFRLIQKFRNFFGRIIVKYKKKHFSGFLSDLSKTTIISNNCIAGTLYHDTGNIFMSPTINLFIESSDFIKFTLNLNKYINSELIELNSPYNYPVGAIEDVNIHFVHYSTFNQAKSKWDERKKRIDFSNIVVIMVDRDMFEPGMLNDFQKIPYKKIFFSSKKFDYDFVIHMKEYNKERSVGIITEFVDFKGNRAYDKYIL